MKYLSLLIIFIFHSCSMQKTEEVTEVSPSNVHQVETPSVKEEVKKDENLDLEFHQKLNQVWSTYYNESYNDTKAIDVIVATNRKLLGTNFGCSNQYFSVESDTTIKESQYRLGICKTNVPKHHTTGDIKFSADPRSDSHRFYKIINSRGINEESFFNFLKESKRIPLIFVHGFNVKHDEAVLRASQLGYDLKYQGPVIVFSWPSGPEEGFLNESLLNRTYEFNKKNAKYSVAAFRNFLFKFINREIPVNILVHSMGHQVVLPAIYDLSKSSKVSINPVSKAINELILNAPDYEVSNFSLQQESIQKLTKRITLYCSYNDKAIAASNSFNKNARLGGCANFENVDSINVSEIDNSTFGLGHSYYSSRSVISDVFQVLIGIEADKRLFIIKSEPNSTEKFYLRN